MSREVDDAARRRFASLVGAEFSFRPVGWGVRPLLRGYRVTGVETLGGVDSVRVFDPQTKKTSDFSVSFLADLEKSGRLVWVEKRRSGRVSGSGGSSQAADGPEDDPLLEGLGHVETKELF
jgi:hypothetical protein